MAGAAPRNASDVYISPVVDFVVLASVVLFAAASAAVLLL